MSCFAGSPAIYGRDAAKYIGILKREGFKDTCRESHWYKFQEAVKEHQKIAKDEILKPIFDKMELKNL